MIFDFKNEILTIFNQAKKSNPSKFSNSFEDNLKIKLEIFNESEHLSKNKETFLSFLNDTDSDIKNLVSELFEISKTKESFNSSLGYLMEGDDSVTLIGREEELKKLSISLERRIKNNVIIIGEPGTGKTSLVQQYCNITRNKVFVVELNKIISNTKYRGEFESKLSELIELAIKTDMIIFIDEIHIILSGSKADGGFSGGDILKPYLTNSKLRLIGATTLEEFEIIKADRALERRFNIIPLTEMPIQILREVYQSFCKKYQINGLGENDFDFIITELDGTSNRNYPDKLVDFLDLYEAMERVGLNPTVREVVQDGFNNKGTK